MCVQAQSRNPAPTLTSSQPKTLLSPCRGEMGRVVCWFYFLPSKTIIITKFLGLTAFKGISGEVWVDHDITSLHDLKLLKSLGMPASRTLDIEESHFSVSLRAGGDSVGVRMRTFFLCSSTGIYEFYFSCFGACEWFIKESEDKEVNITGGSSPRGMGQLEFET